MATKIRFELKQTELKKKLIYLIFSYGFYKVVNGKKSYVPLKYSTALSIEEEFWDKTNQRANKSYVSKFGKKLNDDIDRIKTSITNIYSRFELEGKIPDVEELRKLLNESISSKHKVENKVFTDGEIVDYMKAHYEVEKSKTFDKKAESTLEKYKLTIKKFENYQKAENKTFTFSNLSKEDYLGFFKYLDNQHMEKTSENLAQNSIWDTQKWLNVFLKKGVEEGYKLNIDIKKNRVGSIDVDYPTLSLDELYKLANYDFSNFKAIFNKVQDFAVIMAFTSLRFADLTELSKLKVQSEIFKNYKVYYCNIKLSKVDNETSIPILAPVYKIYKENNDSFPCPMKNQTFNKEIKAMCKFLEFNDDFVLNQKKGGSDLKVTHKKSELIAAHLFRRSFVTNMAGLRIPTDVIEKITHPKKKKSMIDIYNKLPQVHNIQSFFQYLRATNENNWLYENY